MTLLFVGLASANLDFGERVRNALKVKGINPEEVSRVFMKDQVGDIWSNCGSSGDIGTIVKVTITPDPPEKGSDLSVDADITLTEKVTNGTIQIKLQYYVLGIPFTVIDQTIDLCGEETGLTCPLNAGDQNVKFSNAVPSDAPGGKYTGNAVAKNSSGKQIICIDLDFNL